jgi:acyl-CoA hydrolase
MRPYEWSDYIREYSEKLCFADEAVRLVSSGNIIRYVLGGENYLDRALAQRKNELKNIIVYTQSPYDQYCIQKADSTGKHFTLKNAPLDLKQKEPEKSNGRNQEKIKGFIVMAAVSPMDECGYFWFIPDEPFKYQAEIDRAQYVIVEINEFIPSNGNVGSECVHISNVHCIVPGRNAPLMQKPCCV